MPEHDVRWRLPTKKGWPVGTRESLGDPVTAVEDRSSRCRGRTSTPSCKKRDVAAGGRLPKWKRTIEGVGRPTPSRPEFLGSHFYGSPRPQ